MKTFKEYLVEVSGQFWIQVIDLDDEPVSEKDPLGKKTS